MNKIIKYTGHIFTSTKPFLMKTILVILTAICLMLFSSRKRDSEIRYGFDSQFYKNSKGISIMAVDKAVESIYLYGSVEIEEGKFKVDLIDNEGETAYSLILDDPEKLEVNETFKAEPGYWKLKYKSYGGKGNINLHLNN